MFALKVVKAQTKATQNSRNALVSQRSTSLPRPFFGNATVEQAFRLQSTIGNQATLRLFSQQGPE